MSLPDPIEFLGVRVVPLEKARLVDTLTGWASGNERRLVSHVNVKAINLAHGNDRFRSAINSADLVFCDGYGVKWGAARLGHLIPERLAVMDWLDDFAASLAMNAGSLFLLGDEEGVAMRCGEVLQAAHPGLRIAGTHHGFFDKRGPESLEVVDEINASGADVVMVGFGMPLQEFWIQDHFDLLDARVIMPVGAAFRWCAGLEKLAPRWMSERGLEWAARLARHPVKLFGRYVVGNPLYVWRVFRNRRLGRSVGPRVIPQ